ncbi:MULTISPECIES: hypothetical protein [unclassified Arthrobacter]|uniref:hypothetical protein n=1 Tax=unclassified Arthrobacter TaxID=235627 RepID=UPI0014916C1E|nr:hypothetical protein [Arthrobacter sp. AET 35A]MBE0008308.1 hypothetical protein [Arthrobacter sp. AET 35A]NOJ62047.1 hypothetical protein [Arthrobacter sp. 147(2020)]
MNQTPRMLNRVMLGLLGVLLMAVGGLAALQVVPAAARWWHAVAADLGRSIDGLLERTTLSGQQDSWLWIVVALLMLLIVILMAVWIAAQGRGRSGTLAQDYTDGEDGEEAAGRIIINGSVAEQALKSALLERSDLVNATVTTFEFGGEPALKVKVFPRPGVSPHEVATEVTELVEALDLMVGRQTPVLISISAGARARFTRVERVR